MRLIHHFCDKYLLCRESGNKLVLHDLSEDTAVELQNPDLPSQTGDNAVRPGPNDKTNTY